jgi:hypothetical protein
LNPVHNLIYMYIILDSYLEQESFFSRKFYRSSFITGWLSMTDDRDKKGLQIRIKKILYFVVNFGILFYFFEFYVIFYLNHHHYHIFFYEHDLNPIYLNYCDSYLEYKLLK